MPPPSGIGRISGGMLSTYLDRQGSPLHFVSGTRPVLTLDSSNYSISVNSNVATETVTITGNLSTTNVLINGNTISAKNNDTLYLTGKKHLGIVSNVKLAGGQLNDVLYTNTSGDLFWGNLSTLLDGQQFLGNLAIFDNTITAINSNGNVDIHGQGSGSVNISGLHVDMLAADTIVATTVHGSLVGPVTGDVVGNISGNTAVFDSISGTLLTNAQPNITSVGTLSSLTVSSNVTASDVNATIHGDVYTNNIYGISGNLTLTPVETFNVNSTSSFGLPAGTTIQRPPGRIGAIRYNEDVSSPEFFDGSGWIPLKSVITSQSLIGDGVATVFTLNQSTTSNGIIVSINGTLQQPSIAYSVTGALITFAEPPAVTDFIEIRFIASATVVEENMSVVTTAEVGIGNSATVIDGFDMTLFRSAKYTISVIGSNGWPQISELLVTHNGTIAKAVTVSTVDIDGTSASFAAYADAGHVIVTATSIPVTSALRIQKTYFSI